MNRSDSVSVLTAQSKGTLLLAVLWSAVACVGAPEATENSQETDPTTTSAPSSELSGVWSVIAMTSGEESIDPSQPGVFIFTDGGHYSAVYALEADPRPSSATPFDPTPDEKVAQYDTIIVNTGTYETEGSTITTRPMVAKSPEFVGGHSTMEYEISGDVLTLTLEDVVSASGVAAPDVAGTMRLRRLE